MKRPHSGFPAFPVVMPRTATLARNLLGRKAHRFSLVVCHPMGCYSTFFLGPEGLVKDLLARHPTKAHGAVGEEQTDPRLLQDCVPRCASHRVGQVPCPFGQSHRVLRQWFRYRTGAFLALSLLCQEQSRWYPAMSRGGDRHSRPAACSGLCLWSGS